MTDFVHPAAANWRDDYLERLTRLSKGQLIALALKLKQHNVAASAGATAAVGRAEPIAIVGLGCRFPGGVVDAASYWRLLREGRSGIVEMLDQRWDMAAYFDENPETGGKIHSRYLGLLDEVDRFDAEFFSISPREAESMDPQQRLLLEVAWEALEVSGHARTELSGRSVGVFIGMMNKDYGHLMAPDIVGPDAKHSPYYASGEAFSVAAGRLSYILGVHGPCMTVDTACSSSLVAVHLACRSLQEGECEMALAGGTSLILSPEASIVSSNARMLSPSGQCWTFDARADGYVRSEGCAVVALKRLSRALADRNPILATIVASAVNHDGRSQGLTAPSTAAQTALMQSALQSAGLAPASVQYVEAHGTGTPLGDPIEMNSIQAVYGAGRSADEPFHVGAVKTNIGHTEASAGIAGLIKLALCLSNREIVANLNLTHLNPRIVLRAGVELATRNRPWGSPGADLRGAVNSFGFSGTNAHAILESPPAPDPVATAGGYGPQVITISAATQTALEALLRKYSEYLSAHGDVSLRDLAFTTNVGRDHLKERVAIHAATISGLRSVLTELTGGARGVALQGCFRGRSQPERPEPVVLFGPYPPGAAAKSIESLRKGLVPFGDHLDALERAAATLGRTPATGSGRSDSGDVDSFVLGLAVFQTLSSLGLRPSGTLGLGYVGRITAACSAGTLRSDDALRLVICPPDERAESLRLCALNEPKLAILSAHTGESRVADFLTASTRDAFILHDTETQSRTTPDLRVGEPHAAALVLIGCGDQSPLAASWRGPLCPLLDPLPDTPAWEDILGALYAAGLDIDWSAVHRGSNARRIPLPTYAFQRRRYWPGNGKSRVAASREVRFGLEWRELPAGDAASPGSTAERRRILLTEYDVGSESRLRGTYGFEIVALPESWQNRASVELTLSSLGLDGKGLDGKGAPVDVILWLKSGEWADEEISRRAAATASGLLCLTQTLLDTAYSADIHLTVVTEGVEWVPEHPTAIRMADGVAGGFVRALALEHPQLRPRVLDLCPAATTAEKLAQIAMCCADVSAEVQAVWRGARRFVRRLTATQHSDININTNTNTNKNTGFGARSDRAYLITGGLGGVGMTVARWLSLAGAGEIVLLSRRGVVDEQTRARVDSLQRPGCVVRVVAADVAAYESLAAAISRTVELPLAGIVHAAGVLGDAPVQKLTDSHFTEVMRAKVAGSLSLHRLSLDHELDFFVLFSSIAAVVGSAGQANYASANGFLPALSLARRTRGLPSTVVHWGPWAEAGMASTERIRRKLQQSGLGWLAPEVAIDALGDILRRQEPEAVVGRFDWPQIAAYLSERANLPLLSEFVATPAAEAPHDTVTLVAALSAQSEPTALRYLKEQVAATVRRVLAIEAATALDETRSLLELGMDSLLSVELRNRLAAQLELPLPVALMFDHPTVERVSRFLLGELRARAGQTSASANAALLEARREGIDDSADADGHRDDIAIIGVGCRMPGGANSPTEFWERLLAGADLVTPFDSTRWDVSRFYAPGSTEDGKMYSNYAGQLSGVHEFDNDFFGIGDREAEYMDPQQRIVLEVAWETIESAAYTPRELAASAGIFIGPGPSDFADLSQRHARALTGLMGPGHHVSAVAGRVAYALDWQGPCLTIDTACSSSLVAVHVAAQHLRQRECAVALAGGINVILSPANNIVLSKAGMLSPQGRCKTFDRDADGYVRSEGCGLVLLKRLEDAIAGGDHIWGVIRGSAVNQNGQGQGLTAPSGRQQAALIDTALRRAAVRPAEVNYVEAHGTGTQLGDPIEMGALVQTYGPHHDATNVLYVGSVKSNIGHTESAAGIAGLIKVLLMMRHQIIPPNLHLTTLNPLLQLDTRAVRVATIPQRLAREEGASITCAISSFGFSGTNAHMIVRSHAQSRETTPALDCGIFALSARSVAALARLCRRYIDYLERARHPAPQPSYRDRGSCSDICYSTLVGRTRFEKTVCLYPRDREELEKALQVLLGELERGDSSRVRTPVNEVRFNFTATGAALRVAPSLYDSRPALARRLDEVDEVVRSLAGLSAKAVLLSEAGTQVRADDGPLVGLFAQLFLGELLRSLGLEPRMIGCEGDSWLGAAVLYGALPLEEAVRRLVSPGRAGRTPPSVVARLPPIVPLAAGVDSFLTLTDASGEHVELLSSGHTVDEAVVWRTVGELWSRHQDVSFTKLFEQGRFRRVDLPTYPFERRDCSRGGLPAGERSIAELLEAVGAE